MAKQHRPIPPAAERHCLVLHFRLATILQLLRRMILAIHGRTVLGRLRDEREGACLIAEPANSRSGELG